MDRVAEPFYYMAGIGFLAAAKIKHGLAGYTTPKPFPISEVDRCIDYDTETAESLLKYLRAYGGDIRGAQVLELGPGSDLGLGHYLISKGAARYSAMDCHGLAWKTPPSFYARLSHRLGITLRTDLVNYVVRPDFDLSKAFEPASIDVVLSNAAFEHFDDMESTARQLAIVVKPGGKLIANIDLQTHSRWIREQDPNNIYRYPEWLYRMFRFPGQPNRVRPYEYQKFFMNAGWIDVTLTPSGTQFRPRSVHSDFKGCPLLGTGSVVMSATRAA
jgi:SAM-dependent methyltransferase